MPCCDRAVARVDVVVEGDHLVRQLGVAPLERLERAAQRAQDELALLHQRGLEHVQLLLQSRPLIRSAP